MSEEKHDVQDPEAAHTPAEAEAPADVDTVLDEARENLDRAKEHTEGPAADVVSVEAGIDALEREKEEAEDRDEREDRDDDR